MLAGTNVGAVVTVGEISAEGGGMVEVVAASLIGSTRSVSRIWFAVVNSAVPLLGYAWTIRTKNRPVARGTLPRRRLAVR